MVERITLFHGTTRKNADSARINALYGLVYTRDESGRDISGNLTDKRKTADFFAHNAGKRTDTKCVLRYEFPLDLVIRLGPIYQIPDAEGFAVNDWVRPEEIGEVPDEFLAGYLLDKQTAADGISNGGIGIYRIRPKFLVGEDLNIGLF